MPNNNDSKKQPEATVLKKNDNQPKSSNNETVVQAKDIRPEAPPNKNLDNRKTLSTDRRDEALTQLYSSLKTGGSTKGFAKAKNEADAALAENKIILNRRFVLESVIGVGGMGTVYLAKDLRKVEANDLKPHVAVKVLNENFKNHPNAFITLQREASRSHTLSHPNIVTVHDFDRDGDVIFMTMELLSGQPLDDVIREASSGLVIDKATSIIKGFCSALIYAHSKGIIHSDLKPGNIFVTKSAVKVLDFGIARSVSHSSIAGDFDAGSLGALTPAYATIEMFEGKEPHPSDDVFATAIIAYQLLTGKHPYQGNSAQEALKKGIQLVKPVNINRYQWQALQSGLALKRKDRTPSITQFIQTFTHAKRVPIFKILSGTFLIVTVLLVYSIFSAPDEVAIAIDTAYKKAEQCSINDDLNCAIESSKTVLELSPNHAQASQLLLDSTQKFERKIEFETENIVNECVHNRDVICIQNALARLKSFVPNSIYIELFSQKIKDTRRENELIEIVTQGYDCLNTDIITSENITCSQRALNAAFAIYSDYPAALELKQKVDFHYNQLANEDQKRQFKIDDALKAAEHCLNIGNYVCASTKSQEVLALDKNNAKAISINQNAAFEKKQVLDNQAKADKLMSKAKSCFEQKNYTCSIANSESALEFIPNYPAAMKLVKDSKLQIELLKNGFKIK